MSSYYNNIVILVISQTVEQYMVYYCVFNVFREDGLSDIKDLLKLRIRSHLNVLQGGQSSLNTRELEVTVNIIHQLSILASFLLTNAHLSSSYLLWKCMVSSRSFFFKLGEEGVDDGGLSREFYSLFYRQHPAFNREAESLNHSHTMMHDNTYKFVGQVVAMGIAHGHPGPKCFNLMLSKYILRGELPVEFLDRVMVATDCIMAVAKV